MRVSLPAAALVAAALGLSAYTSGGGGPGAAASGRPASSSAAGKVGERSFELVGYPTRTAAVPEQPLAAGPTTFPGLELGVSVVRRTEQAVLVVFGLHNTGTSERIAGFSGSSLGKRLPFDNTVGGVSLVDTAGLRQYLVLRPADPDHPGQALTSGPCACSAIVGSEQATFPRDEVRYFAALVTAPPAGVGKVSFVSPIGTVAGLSIDG